MLRASSIGAFGNGVNKVSRLLGCRLAVAWPRDTPCCVGAGHILTDDAATDAATDAAM